MASHSQHVIDGVARIGVARRVFLMNDFPGSIQPPVLADDIPGGAALMRRLRVAWTIVR